ncbi:MAG: hypothetical protein RR729_07950 [Comamonas sp.]
MKNSFEIKQFPLMLQAPGAINLAALVSSVSARSALRRIYISFVIGVCIKLSISDKNSFP